MSVGAPACARNRAAILPVALGMVLTSAPALATDRAVGAGRATARVVGSAAIAQESGLASGPFATGRRGACHTAKGCRMAQPAGFSLRGEPERSYQVTVPATIRFDGELRLSAIEVRTLSRPGEGADGRIDAGGSDRFGVGATLHLPETLAPGRYAGDFRVVVAYN